MSSKFIYKEQFSKKSNKELNSIKRVKSITTFKNESNGRTFQLTDVEMLKHNRNKKINEFFNVYENIKDFDLIEFGVPYIITEKIERITQKIKRRSNSNGYTVLGFLWIFDVGEENFGAHYHLIIAIRKHRKIGYPDFLKIDFKNKAIHGSFVSNRMAFRRYLLVKNVFERGLRKRIFGNSRRFKILTKHNQTD